MPSDRRTCFQLEQANAAMELREIISWYQKKIGTYDKQQWEKTIEDRILQGLTHVPMKTAKLKTDFIDLDLVRGSSFPKAKPKHGLLMVSRLATLRLVFLPVYSKWWIQQTSPRIFMILLVLYILQLFNVLLYMYKTNDAREKSENNVPASEVVAPLAMMLILSLIHSQIVSTNSGSDRLMTNSKARKTTRLRRRRTLANIRRRSTSEKVVETNSEFQNCSQEESCGNKVPRAEVRLNAAKSRRRKIFPETAEKNDSIFGQDAHKLNKPVSRQDSANEDSENGNEAPPRGNPLEDDGFESLNGNASSENGDESLLTPKSCKEMKFPKSSQTIPSSFMEPANSSNSTSTLRTWPTSYLVSSGEHESDTESEAYVETRNTTKDLDILHRFILLTARKAVNRKSVNLQIKKSKNIESSCFESEEEDNARITSQASSPLLNEVTTSATEWIGVTTNSEECSYSSEYESDSNAEMNNNNDHASWDFDLAPTVILNPSCAPSDKVSCTIWDVRDVKKAELSVLDISSAIIACVETMPETMDYFYGGIAMATILAFLPPMCRLAESAVNTSLPSGSSLSIAEMFFLLLEKLGGSMGVISDVALGPVGWERTVLLIALIERWALACLFFFLLAIAERTFKQRFLYAKLFSHLTSSRRARKSNLPHFRLNKVRNIKTWLSVRSYLKRKGPQRSVDVIVSAAFITTLILLSFISMEFLKDSVTIHSQYNLEALVWSLSLGVFLLRFMTLGTKINRKYRNLSVLITEQINLYLQIEQKPKKKEELMVANSVLKLAADLLKELESPFKISGLSANPYLYTITKVVILSALSGVLSEILGFKLKLHKIKIK